MGCHNSKSSANEDNHQNQSQAEDRQTPQNFYLFKHENREGVSYGKHPIQSVLRRSSETASAAERNVYLPRRARHHCEGALPISSFGTLRYPSKKCMIISAAAGQPHFLSADAVNQKLQQIRDELRRHDNDIVTDAEREYFIEQRCWDFLFPNQKEVFMVYRPRSSIIEETIPEYMPSCDGCMDLEQSMDSCPWTVTTSCPIFYHQKYKVRFGYEMISRCPQCQAEEEP